MNTKRSLLTSSVALLLCFVMLLGTTYAWFTDSVTSSGNVIQSGNLDIDLMKGEYDGSAWNWTSTEGQAIFNYDKWEPGYTSIAVLAVENSGTLSAKWAARLVINDEPGILADVIDVYATSYHNYSTSRPDFEDGTWQKLGSVADLVANGGNLPIPGGKIDPGHRQPILIALHMREDAGNEYQGLSLGTNFDITILATQATYEEDSFGPDYDMDSTWPAGKLSFATSASLEQVATVNNELQNELVIRYNDSVYAVLPAGVKLADGVESLQFSGKSVETGSNITLGEGDNAKSYDIHIEGIADDNTQPIKVYLGAILESGISETSLKLYHEGTQMTKVNSVSDFAINNQFVYDFATGNVVLYVDNFSVFSTVETDADKLTADTVADTSWYVDHESDDEYTLNSAAAFVGFRDLVDAGNTFAGKTVKLGVDIDLAGINFDPIGYEYESNDGKVFKGIFDGQNHTIYNLYQNGWDLDPNPGVYDTYTYSTAGAGLFASVVDAEIKNLAVSGANIVFECVDMGIVAGYAYGTCNFENIVVTNSQIQNYNRYTGGVVGEVNGTHTFKNITVDSSVVISSLWGSFDTSIGGVIGGKYGTADVTMENVIVAAELDVYSDVTSAYQWYAYRRCGMLIGHTEQNSPKHAETATANFLTCDNVKVYYGDWINYTYCEFEHSNNPGSRYPWVREQAGLSNSAYSNPRYGHPIDSEGNKVTNATHKHADGEGCNVSIPFNQLYGGGQGVYGEDQHNNVTTYKPAELTKTIYFQNNWKWEKVYLYYWYEHISIVDGKEVIESWNNTAFPGEAMTKVGNDGTYDIYKFEVPAYASGFVFNNGTTLTDPEHQQSVDVDVTSANDGYIYSVLWCGVDNAQTNYVAYHEYTTAKNTIYFKPGTEWEKDNARFAAYFFGNGEKWVSMSDTDGDGIFTCQIPSGYKNVIFCRMNPSTTANNWNNKWNQTVDISLQTDYIANNLYTITTPWSDKADGTWSAKNYIDNN